MVGKYWLWKTSLVHKTMFSFILLITASLITSAAIPGMMQNTKPINTIVEEDNAANSASSTLMTGRLQGSMNSEENLQTGNPHPMGIQMDAEHDVGVDSIISPITDGPGTSYPVKVVIKNYGQYPERWFNTSVQIGSEIQTTQYATDFEVDNGGFSQTGSYNLWVWGAPTSGPGAAHSGGKLWATVLGGNYINNANEKLDSPAITIPSNARLSFWHWFSTEAYWDGGNIKVSVSPYSTWTLLGSYRDPYNEDAMSPENSGCPGEPGFSGNSSGWRYVVMDLDAYAGQTIKIRFHFGSDPMVSSYPGWYVDDVRVYTSSPDPEYVDEDWQEDYLQPGETREITFDTFTPEALAEGNSGEIIYVISACTTLSGDAYPPNDDITEYFVLTYTHDVTVKKFNEPSVAKSGRDEIIFSQRVYTPHETWNFYISDINAGYLCQDDFWNLTDPILDVHWDGLPLIYSGGRWYQGNPSGMTFEITFYADSDGSPGSVVAIFTGLEPYFETGEMYAGVYQAYIWSIDLPEEIILDEGWISIQSTYAPDNSWFLWGGSPEGNANALQNGSGLGDSLAFVLATIHWYHPTLVYVKKGSTEPIQVLVNNVGTFVETCTLSVELKEYITDPHNGTSLYNDTVAGIVLDPLGDEQAVDFQSQLYALEGIYALFANLISSSIDDVSGNNVKILVIGSDGTTPKSSYSLRPAEPDGDNGWYESNVTIKLTAYDPIHNDVSSGVARIEYQIDGGLWQIYPGLGGFKLTTDGQHTVKHRAIDKVGNIEEEKTIPVIMIDKTKPTIALSYNVTEEHPLMDHYTLTFCADASDVTSGLDHCEFYFNGLIQVTIEGPGPQYQWSYDFAPLPHVIVKAVVYDATGNNISGQIEDPTDLEIITEPTQQLPLMCKASLKNSGDSNQQKV